VRVFDSGATRNDDKDKLDFEAFLAPSVLEAFAQYMHKHRVQADGSLRDGDNWQRGMDRSVYMKSAWRHFFAVWKKHRSAAQEDPTEDLCALLFNVMGYLFEVLKAKQQNQAPVSGLFVPPGIHPENLINGCYRLVEEPPTDERSVPAP
jgi:hypothetical protein